MTAPKPEPGLGKRKEVSHHARCVQCWQRQAAIVTRMRRSMNRQNGGWWWTNWPELKSFPDSTN